MRLAIPAAPERSNQLITVTLSLSFGSLDFAPYTPPLHESAFGKAAQSPAAPPQLLLAAVVLEDDKADEAIREFQAGLMEAPNNAYALFGLMSAQEAAGDAAGAKVTQALFDKAWAGGADRPTLADL